MCDVHFGHGFWTPTGGSGEGGEPAVAETFVFGQLTCDSTEALGRPILPLPCQKHGGNRCATRGSPRSGRTVDAVGKRSLGVQGNALFGRSTVPLVHVLLASGAHESFW